MEYRLKGNVEGTYYVTNACINCDQCRQIAPVIFSEEDNFSAVTQQPGTNEEERKALHALVSCPTGAIKGKSDEGLLEAIKDFPLQIHDHIFYCGFTSRKSWGASSYFIAHQDGNWLIDSPRWASPLVKKLEEMGGVKYIFLTHQDDVADAEKYAERFHAERFIHIEEKKAQPNAEHLLEGTAAIPWHPDFKFIMIPGHTKGHMALLFKNRYLFTGDHLAWDRETNELAAFQDYCWHSWSEQITSMERLQQESFEWILPGHGDRVYLPQVEMRKAMLKLVQDMKRKE